MTRVRVATVAGDIGLEGALAESLVLDDRIELVLRCLDRVELLAAIRGGDLDVLVFVEEPTWVDRQCLVEASDRGLSAVTLANEARFVDPRGVLGRDADISTVVNACMNAPDLHPPSLGMRSRSGRITAVWGPKGSPGRTRVAFELATLLSSGGTGTLLMDADPYGGDALQMLGIVEELPTIVWASRMAGKEDLDEEQLRRNLRSAADGMAVLPGLPRPELWADVSRFAFGELLKVARGSFDHTVVDTGFCLEPGVDVYAADDDGRNRMTRASLIEADRVAAVCRADPIGIKSFLWAYEELRPLVDPDRIVIVANRVVDGSEREVAKLLQKHLGKRPVAYLPDRPGILDAALKIHGSVIGIRGSGDLRAGIEALGISVGARLKPRGVLTSLGGKR